MSEVFKKIIFALIFILLFSCSTKEQKQNKLTIATTIVPYKYLISEIAGNKVEILSSLPEKASPHHFDPSAKLIEEISQVDNYFRVGPYLNFEEVWLGKLKDMNSELRVFDLSDGINFIDHDPHVWLAPENLNIIAKNIFQNLVQLIPAEEETFEKNYNNFIKRNNKIKSEIDSVIVQKGIKTMLVYHGSWTYFANEFGIKQLVIEYGSKEPTPQKIKSILEEAKNYRVPVVFVDPQHGTASSQLIADELSIPISVLRPLEENVLKNLIEVKNNFEKYY